MRQKNKYHNKKVLYDGKWFDSRKEKERYVELSCMEMRGEIEMLRTQVPFELVPEQREPATRGPKGGIRKGKLIERPITYIADFVYVVGGDTIVEDIKSEITRHNPEYIIKRKLMLFRYGIRVKEV